MIKITKSVVLFGLLLSTCIANASPMQCLEDRINSDPLKPAMASEGVTYKSGPGMLFMGEYDFYGKALQDQGESYQLLVQDTTYCHCSFEWVSGLQGYKSLCSSL